MSCCWGTHFIWIGLHPGGRDNWLHIAQGHRLCILHGLGDGGIGRHWVLEVTENAVQGLGPNTNATWIAIPETWKDSGPGGNRPVHVGLTWIQGGRGWLEEMCHLTLVISIPAESLSNPCYREADFCPTWNAWDPAALRSPPACPPLCCLLSPAPAMRLPSKWPCTPQGKELH